MPTAKAVNDNYVSGVFLGEKETDDIDPKTGLISLEHKDRTNLKEGKTRFGTREFDGTRGYIYSSVKEPSEKQKSVVEIVNDVLGAGWTYRQIRDYSGRSQTPVKSDLKKGRSFLPLVFVYQRETKLSETTPDSFFYSELERLTSVLVNASDRVTVLVAPRYTLTDVQVVYDWRADVGRSGEGSDDVRIAMACLYFSDKAEQLHDKRIKLVKSKTRSEKLTFQIKDLEAELSR